MTNSMVDIFASQEKTNDSVHNVETIVILKFYEKLKNMF